METTWIAGHNIPGCLPDSPAWFFDTWDEAIDCVLDELDYILVTADQRDIDPDTVAAVEAAIVYFSNVGEDMPASAQVGEDIWWVDMGEDVW